MRRSWCRSWSRMRHKAQLVVELVQNEAVGGLIRDNDGEGAGEFTNVEPRDNAKTTKLRCAIAHSLTHTKKEREKFEAFVSLRKRREWRVSINRRGRVHVRNCQP